MVACNQHCNIHYLKRLTYVDLEVCVARRDANNQLRLGLRMRTVYHVMLKPLYYVLVIVVNAGSKGKERFRRPLRHFNLSVTRLATLSAP